MFDPVQTPHCHCLACNSIIDACTNMTADTQPRGGDITICLDCGHIMAFEADLTLRNLTAAEMISVAGDPEIIKIQKARVAALADRKS